MNKPKMTEFLQFIAKIAEQNDNINYFNNSDCRGIYHHLVRIGIEDDEKKIDVSQKGFFNQWINHFKNKKNIFVFVDPRWSYFCQFINEKNRNTDYIKLYVPTKHEFLLENAEIIFEYLRQENIDHSSKIAKEVRFDNIVIRLANKQDADKLINFINNSSKLQKGLIEPNPFAFTKNKLSLACDGHLSYNTVVSQYIGMYIQNKKEKSDLGNVNADDFINYIKIFYKEVFQEGKHFAKCMDYFDINFNEKNNSKIANLKNITELIINSYQDDYNYDRFIEHFNKCNNPLYIKKEIALIQNIDTNINDDLLKEYFQVMEAKYGLDFAIKSLLLYIKTGDNHGITRDNNLRKRITESNILENLNDYFQQKKYSIDEIRHFLLQYSSKSKIVTTEIDYDIKQLLNEYLIIMSKKYGLKTAINNLLIYLKTWNTDFITRENNLRKKIYDSDIKKELSIFFQNNNFTTNDIINWLTDYYNNIISNNYDYSQDKKKS